MYQYNIEAMARKATVALGDAMLIEAGIVRKHVRRVIGQALRDHWKDKIAIEWTTDDVHEATSDELTEEQAREVLEYVLDHYDQDDGVNLEIIKNAIDDCKDKWRLQ